MKTTTKAWLLEAGALGFGCLAVLMAAGLAHGTIPAGWAVALMVICGGAAVLLGRVRGRMS